MSQRLLIADDDVELCELLRTYLQREGFDVEVAHDGRTALGAVRAGSTDVLVLDVMMPGMNGLDVLRELRRESMLPVIMLTARGDDVDRILGLELGADDYLPKPCNPRELLARIRAVLRRAATAAVGDTLRVNDLVLDPGRRELRRDGEVLGLTSTEFSVLQRLLADAGRVVEKAELYRSALGREPVRFDRSIDMHVSNLRRKLGDAPGGGPRIDTVRGIGYQYRA